MRYQKNVWLLVLMLIISACTKTVFDDRRKYIGDNEFTINMTCTPNIDNCDTTYTYNGSVEYSKDKGKVIIKFESNYTIEPEIDDNNHLIQQIDHYQDNDLGKFINKDEVEFEIRSGGHGGGFYRNVYGKKK